MQTFDFLPFTDNFSPSRSMFVITSNTRLEKSSVNNSQMVVENPGANIVVRYVFKVIYADDGLGLRGRLNKLQGSLNTIRLFDPTYQRRGTWSGAPVVDGEGIYGTELPLRGFTPNTLIARASDRCQALTQLYETTDDVISDGTGRAVLPLANEIRQPLSDGTPIVSDPLSLRALCRWTRPEQIQQLQGNRRLYKNVTLDFEEYMA
ncbi:MAG: hypothetical protein Alis3KO_01040 [Aliiglaciecola sp.]